MGELLIREANRCLLCGKPLCKQGCPIGNDFAEFVRLIRLGDSLRAVRAIGHPFGEICGYVCPCEELCQGQCALGRKSNSVLTNVIERELFAEYPYELKRLGNALQGKKYAVVGGGVSGLTFAAKAYEQGADVTVFERDEPLSTLKLIPSFRLPREAVLRVENQLLSKLNVERRQIDGAALKTLKTQFDGAYVATGLTMDYGLGVEGQEFAVNYRDCLKGNIARGTVVIVGGGNSAMDCARLVRSQGRAIVAYRRQESDMPAFKKEIAEAKAEGVEFLFNAAPVRLARSDGGLQLTLAKTLSEGRGKLTVTEEEFIVKADAVVAAIGSKFDDGVLERERNLDSYLQYGNVYLGGDAKRGKLVADAVADALKAAEEIIKNARKACL